MKKLIEADIKLKNKNGGTTWHSTARQRRHMCDMCIFVVVVVCEAQQPDEKTSSINNFMPHLSVTRNSFSVFFFSSVPVVEKNCRSIWNGVE